MTTRRDAQAATTAADRLRAAVRACPKTREQIAKESGIDLSTLSRMMNGRRRIRVDALECLSPVLGVSLEQLMTGDVSAAVRAAPVEMPEGLARYLEGREDRIAPAVVKAMRNSQFQAVPGVVFDDAFWDEQRILWEKRLGLQPLRPVDQRGPGTGS